MASSRKGAALAAVAPTTPAPTPIALDLHNHAVITLMPLDVRRRALQLTADAQGIVEIGSAGALETADLLASAAKALEVEIEENCKAQLAPIEAALKSAKTEIKGVLMPLAEARSAITERVVLAKGALGFEGSTSCYAQERAELEIKDLRKIPHVITYTCKKTGEEITEHLLVPDIAAINRALRAGAHVPGVYQGSKTVYGTRST